MRLLSDLIRASYTVKVEAKRGSYPNFGLLLGVRNMLVVTVTSPQGIEATRWVEDYFIDQLEEVLASILKVDFPKCEAYAKWCDRQGHQPVRLARNAMKCFDELIHAGLRKLTDTPESCINWKALCYLSEDDRTELFTATKTVIKELFKTTPRPSRRQVAERVKGIVHNILYNKLYNEHRNNKLTRRPAEVLALEMFLIGINMISLEEWMWGWLRFILEDRPQNTGSLKNGVKKTGQRKGAALVKRATRASRPATGRAARG